MKQSIVSTYNLVLVLLFIFLVACSEQEALVVDGAFGYVYVPDENFERELIELGIDSDGEINQHLLRKDAQEVSTLILDMPLGTSGDDKIKDLVGLEEFKNLQHLSLVNNAISSIYLKENKQLVSIDLSINNLRELDISQNTSLVELNVISNQLTKITGLEQAQNLKVLAVSQNHISQLDISHLGQLEALDVEQNNNLACIKIAEEQSVPTMNKDVNQVLSVNACE